MARAYSRDLRERLLQLLASGLSAVEVAQRTGVRVSRLHRWKTKAETGESLEPRHSPGGPRKIGPEAEAALRDQVAAHPDATLAEHCAFWQQAGQEAVSVATMSRALQRLGWPLKKRA